MNEMVYIDKVYSDIVFNKFKVLSTDSNVFSNEDIPQETKARNVDEILKDIYALVGLTEVKASKNNTFAQHNQYLRKINITKIQYIR